MRPAPSTPSTASARLLRGDERAVSAVVSAVLLFGLFVTVSLVYTLQTLPQWEADNEQNHQRAVREGLSGLKASVEGLSGRNDPGPVSAVLPLGADTVPLLQRDAATGSVSFQSGGNGIAMTTRFASTPGLFSTNGVASATPSVALTTAPCSGACLQSLSVLVLGLATSGTSGTATVDLSFTDSAATPATVTATVSFTTTPTNCAAVGMELDFTLNGVAKPLLCGLLTPFPASGSYSLDLLDASLGLSPALGRLTAPYSIAFSSGSSGALVVSPTYAAVWTDANGIEQMRGTGLTASATPIADLTGGRLVFAPLNLHYPSQDLSYEGGGIVSAGLSMAVDPSFAVQADTASGTGYLRWSYVNLAGTGSVGGGGDATVKASHASTQDLLLQTTGATTFTLGTPSAIGWCTFLRDRVVAAGGTLASGTWGSTCATAATYTLAGTTYAFSRTTTSTPVLTLVVTPGGSTPTLTLHLRTIQASVQVS
jgi:hypothetical protein